MTTVDPRRPTGADEGRSIARNMAHGIRYMAQATRGARSRHRQGAVSRRLRVARRGGPLRVSPLLSPSNRPLASTAEAGERRRARRNHRAGHELKCLASSSAEF